MKSPQISTVVIAIVFAVIAYFLSSTLTLTPAMVAGIVFVSAFIASLIAPSSDTSTASAEQAAASEEVKTLYVGNLPYRANEAAVRELFSNHGNVQSVRLMKDKHTGKRRGFGFVEMAANDVAKAISALNDSEFQQRTLKVREAKERPERSSPENS
jgi:RNA recognition motif-containing protein